MKFDGSLIDADLTKYTKQITSPFQNSYRVTLTRKISPETLNNLFFVGGVPGFHLKWKYNLNVGPEGKYINNTANLMFARYGVKYNVKLLFAVTM